ncbi:MAG TPA: hypothetical protein VGN80_18700 [Devosiaceae bacterium]|jgi:hypothetical protein|nr:hypothetical protein [Devosiaceae bacterium]
MKFVSLIALTAALAISSPTLTVAQDATAGGTAGAAASGTADTEAGGTNASADTNAEAGVDANVDSDGDVDAGVDASVDTDGDGQISDEEQAAADAAADTDGDGVVSAEERAAAEAGGTASCSEVNIGTLAGMQQGAEEAAIAAATNARVVLVGDCAADELSSTLASDGSVSVQSAVGSNPELVSQIQARGATVADIIGAAVVAGTLTIYVADDGATD